MPNIDEKVVQMQFDNSEFDPNIKKSQKTFEEFEKTLEFDKGSKALKNFQKDMDKVDTKGLSNQLGKLGESFSVFETVAVGALLSVGNRLENFLNKALRMALIDGAYQGWGVYGETVSSTQTIMAATASQFKDTAKQINYVTSEIELLRTYSDETSYSFKDMTDNVGKFTSQGIRLDKAVDAMEGISNWAALSGANTAQASRAMYNLSQALGVGSVMVRDWMSIENANMATVEFKQTAIDTALALGTLKKDAQGVIKTLDNSAVVTVSNFRDSLDKHWFTSDVLMQSISKYGSFSKKLLNYVGQMENVSVRDAMKWIDEYAEGIITLDAAENLAGKDAKLVKEMLKELGTEEYSLGRRSFRAAQETKTFAEAINYVKGTISTGWGKTFEYIFGNYEQAKAFWTDVTEDLYELFVKAGEFRNEVMELWSKTFGREDFVAAVDAIRKFFFGFDQGEEHIKGVRDFIREAWEAVFPFWNNKDQIASALVTITKKFREWAESLRANEETMANLKSVITFIGRVFKFLLGIIKGLIIFFAPLVKWTKQLLAALRPLFRSLLDAGGAALTSKKFFEGLYTVLLGLGAVLALPIKLLQMLVSWLERLGNKTWPEIVEDFNAFREKIRIWISGILTKFAEFGKNIVAGFWKGFAWAWKAVYTAISKAFSGIITLVKNIFGIHSPSAVFMAIGGFLIAGLILGIVNSLGGLSNVLGTVINAIGSSLAIIFETAKRLLGLLGNIFSTLASLIEKIVLPVLNLAVKALSIIINIISQLAKRLLPIIGILAIIAAIVAVIGVIIGIVKFFVSISKILTGIASIFDGVSSLLKGIGDFARKMGTARVVSAFGDVALKFAASVAILVAAFVVLAKLDLPKIKQAGIVLGAILAVMIGLLVVMGLLAKAISKGKGDVPEESGGGGFFGRIKGFARSILGVDPEVASALDSIVNMTTALKNIAMTVGIMAASLVLIAQWMKKANVSTKEMWSLAGMFMAFLAVFSIIYIVVISLTRKQVELASAAKTIKEMGKSFIKIALALLVMTFATKILASIPLGSLISAVGALAVITLMIGLLMSKVSTVGNNLSAKQIGKFALLILTFANSLLLIMGSLAILVLFSRKDLGSLWAAIGALATLVIIFSVIISKVSKISNSAEGSDIAKNLAVMFATITALYALGGLAILLSLFDIGKIFKTVGVIAAFGALFIGITAIFGAISKKYATISASTVIKALLPMLAFLISIASLIPKLLILATIADKIWNLIGAISVVGLVLLAFSTVTMLLAKTKINIANFLLVVSSFFIFVGLIALLINPLKEIASIGSDIWRALGSMATMLGILLVAVGLVLLLGMAAGAIMQTGWGILGIVAVIAGMVVIVVMLAAISKPLKAVADALKYFQDTIGVKSLLVGVYILGLSLMLSIAGVLLLAAVPGMLAAAIGMVAFVAAATYAGKNANYISAFFEVIKDIASWKMLGKLALFAAGLAVLGLGLQILAPGLIGAAIAFAVWTAALILAGKYTDVIIDAFRIFSAITWEMVGGMAKLSLGLLALSVGLFAVSVPLMMIIIPLAALIGLGALLLETLYKLGKNMDLFAKAIDIVHAKLDKITDIIREFGKALGEVAPALQAFGRALLIIGAGILVMAVGMFAAGIAGLVIVGVLFLFVLLLDRIKRDHPRLYDIIMDVVDGIAQMVKKEADLLGESYTLSKGLEDICETLLGLVKDIGDAVGSVITGIGDLVGGALSGLGNLLSGKNREYKRLIELAEAQTNLANAQARLAEANVAFNASLKELGPKLDSYLGSLSKSTGVFEQLGIIAQSYRSDIRRLGEDAKFLYSQLAKDTIKGYIDGLTDGNAKLTAQADHMVKLILNTMKKGLDINSPSRRMYEIGTDTVEGFDEGAEDYWEIAMQNWKDRLDRIRESTKKTVKQIKDYWDDADLRAAQSEFNALEKKMYSKDPLSSDEWKRYYELQNKLTIATNKRIQEQKKEEKESATLGETLKNVGSDMKTIIEKVKSGEMTLKEGLSAAWTSLKTNFGGFLGDKFGDLKEWLLGDDGLLSGFRGLFDNLLNGDLFQGLGLEDYLPDIDENTGDIYDAMNTSDLTGAVDPTSGTSGSSNTINTYEFVQNNYSPKALSRIEIYRQTNRQFNNFRTREVLAR